jgi:hydrogenase maturation factor
MNATLQADDLSSLVRIERGKVIIEVRTAEDGVALETIKNLTERNARLHDEVVQLKSEIQRLQNAVP